MTVTPEMREAGAAAAKHAALRGDAPTWTQYDQDWSQAAEAAYLAMRDKDPEVAEMRRKLADAEKVFGDYQMMLPEADAAQFAINNQRAEIDRCHAFLTAQGYTRAADGTWASLDGKTAREITEYYDVIMDERDDAERHLEYQITMLHDFLRLHGYAKGPDGTWGGKIEVPASSVGVQNIPADAEQLGCYIPVGCAVVSTRWLDTQLAQFAAAHDFLRGQGFAQGEDGTWGKP